MIRAKRSRLSNVNFENLVFVGVNLALEVLAVDSGSITPAPPRPAPVRIFGLGAIGPSPSTRQHGPRVPTPSGSGIGGARARSRISGSGGRGRARVPGPTSRVRQSDIRYTLPSQDTQRRRRANVVSDDSDTDIENNRV